MEKGEEVDVFDVFKTGEVLAIMTKKEGLAETSRLIVHMINYEDNSDKFLSYDFRINPEKYFKVKQFSSFFKVYINFMFEGSPIVVGFQEAANGAKFNVFVGRVRKEGIQELCYEEGFMKGRFVSANVVDEFIFVFDEARTLGVIDLGKK